MSIRALGRNRRCYGGGQWLDGEDRWGRSTHPVAVEESLVVLGLAGGAGVGHAQRDELADVSVLVPLQLGPEHTQIQRLKQPNRTCGRKSRRDQGDANFHSNAAFMVITTKKKVR